MIILKRKGNLTLFHYFCFCRIEKYISRRDKFVILPSALEFQHSLRSSINSLSISKAVCELSFITLPIRIYHYSVRDFSMLEFTFKRVPIEILVMAGMLLIVFPFSSKFISIHVSIKTFTFSLTFFDMTLVELIFSKFNEALTIHQICFKVAFILDQTVPFVCSFPILLRTVKSTFKIVSIFVKYLATTLNMIVFPSCFNFCAI